MAENGDALCGARLGGRAVPEPALFALDRLEQAGYEAALVGGCVRDALMGRTPGDYDVASSASPQEAMEALKGEKIVPTGLKHGTILLVRQGMPIEITSFREDGEYADMRRPESVRFTKSLREDVKRRDFTMNALAWERGRGLIDLVGGEADIRNGLIRAVGDAKTRFTEDALRILRALRFAAQLGFSIDPEAKAAICALYPNLEKISRERVRQELWKLIAGKSASAVLIEYESVFRSILPCEAAISPEQWRISAARLEAVGQAEASHIHTPDDGAREQTPLLLAALLLPAGERATGETLRALRSDEKSAREAALLVRLARELTDAKPRALRALIGDNGLKTARDAVRLRFAFEEEDRNRALAALREITEKGLPCKMNEMAVDGEALGAVGITGKQTGRVLRALLEEIRADATPNERDALLARAKEIQT